VHLPRLPRRIMSVDLLRAAVGEAALVYGTVWQIADRLGTEAVCAAQPASSLV
jgi:hypothetical protein